MMIKKYNDKMSALKNMKNNENLYSIDKNCNGAKYFFNSTFEEISNLLKKDNHIYENIENDKPLKLFLDIDYKISEEYEIKFENEKELIDNVLTTFNSYLNKENLKSEKYIIFSSKTQTKYSFHVIYNDIIFDNIKSMKNFMNKFNIENSEYKDIIDDRPYKVGCLRCFNQSKINKKNIKNIYYQSFECDILDTLLFYIDDSYKKISFEKINYVDEKKLNVKNEVKKHD